MGTQFVPGPPACLSLIGCIFCLLKAELMSLDEVLMPRPALYKLLNDLSALFTLKAVPSLLEGGHTFFSAVGVTLYLSADNAKLFEAAVEHLHASVLRLNESLSRKSFVDLMIPLISEKLTSGTTFSQADADVLNQQLAALPML